MADTHIEIPGDTRLGSVTRSVIRQGQSWADNIRALLKVYGAFKDAELPPAEQYATLGTALNITTEEAKDVRDLFNALSDKFDDAPDIDIFFARLG